MCELCIDGEMEGCQQCGCLICFDVENGDDIIRPAHVTAAGDLFCDRCGREMDRAEEEEADYYIWDGWDTHERVMQSDAAKPARQTAGKYPVLCAWCLKEGKENIVNWSTIPNSHGICPRHMQEQVARAKEISQARAELSTLRSRATAEDGEAASA